jgi:hypothetical protein
MWDTKNMYSGLDVTATAFTYSQSTGSLVELQNKT